MDIDIELGKILRKYGYEIGLVQKRIFLYDSIDKILKKACDGKRCIAIKCGGIHSKWLMRDFLYKYEISYIIDNNVGENTKMFNNVPIIKSFDKSIDLVIISSYEYRESAKEDLELQGCHNYVDIYEELSKENIVLHNEYYHFYDEPYKYLIEQQNLYRKEKSEIILSNIIQEFLSIRDFVSSLFYIDEYIANKFYKYEEKIELKKELNLYLEMVRDICIKRKTKDILWFWQDGLQTYAICNMPFFQDVSKKGISFLNSYSPSPTTRSVYGRILDEMEEFDIYDNMNEWPVEHPTIKMLEEKGYSCYRMKRLGEEPQKLLKYDYHNEMLIFQNAAMTECIWSGIRMLLLDDRKKCILIHTGMETHAPVMAPNLQEYKNVGNEGLGERFYEEGREKYLEKLSKTVKYVDDQWKLFYHILGDKSIKVYMSDHGDILSRDSYYFTKDSCQTVLTVLGNDIKAKQYQKLFCITSFGKMLCYILEPNLQNESNMFSEIIWMNGVDVYNKKYIEELLELGFAEYGLAYDGYMTLYDRYIVLGTGEEIYTVFPDEYINRINDEKYKERIHFFRSKIKARGLKFIDIKRNSKFCYSHILYDELGKDKIILF